MDYKKFLISEESYSESDKDMGDCVLCCEPFELEDHYLYCIYDNYICPDCVEVLRLII